MKRLVPILLVVLATISFDSNAQNASIPTPSNPQKVAEYCYHCGWVKAGESHRSDCPYTHGGRTTSGNSSSGNSVRNNPAFTAADAGINALGTILSGLLASAFEPNQSKSGSSSASDRPMLSAEQLADYKTNCDYWIDRLFEDRDFWEYGDYVIALDGAMIPGTRGARAISIRNKKTGEYILGPIDQKTANLLEKDKFPAYTMLIAQLPKNKEEYKSFANNVSQNHWDNVGLHNAGRVRFFDSSKENTPEELDGKLLIDGRWYWPNPNTKRKDDTQFSQRFGLYQIAENQLKPVFVVEPTPAPFVGERFELFGNYGFFRYWHKAESKWIDDSTTPRKEIIIVFMASDLYSLDGKVFRKDIIHLMPSTDSTFLWCLDYATLGGSFRDYHENRRDFSEYNYSALDKNMNPVPQFEGYDFLSPQRTIAGQTPVIAGKDGQYGVVHENGQVLIPLIYVDPVQVKQVLKTYEEVGFSCWYKNMAEKLLKEKGEFEKQEHFEARSKDPQLQKAYLEEHMGAQTESIYITEMKKSVNITLGRYDSEKECFPIYFKPASWNGFSLPVPIAEAQAFKEAFDQMKDATLNDASYCIRHDAIAIDEISFTLPSGKTYHAKL
ncbi:MAG: hypothetical protein ILP04_00840 [Bacteroidales bacterium]|nr:hypothetical protein [Bacteroidales bacterium]